LDPQKLKSDLTFASGKSHRDSVEEMARLDEMLRGNKKLDPKKFRVGLAMGVKQQNLVNKAYKSTNTDQVDLLKDSLPSLKSVKMTKNELEETLSKFRCDQVNILIATNVVEEGLDVSTCNQVICLNELMTVKAFIQMKGRARQVDSKFIFLAAHESWEKVKDDQDAFARVISHMQVITMRAQRKQRELAPHENIIEQK